MEKTTSYPDQIEQYLTALNDEKISQIDFDAIKVLLSDIISELNKSSVLRTDLEVLQNDYICRMSGMLKAVSITGQKKNNPQEIMDLIESLAGMSAKELVDSYRKISARFRDAFPSSFSFMDNKTSNKQYYNLNDYK